MSSMIKSDFVKAFEELIANLSTPPNDQLPVDASVDRTDKVVQNKIRKSGSFFLFSQDHITKSGWSSQHQFTLINPETRVVHSTSNVSGGVRPLNIPEQDRADRFVRKGIVDEHGRAILNPDDSAHGIKEAPPSP